MTRLKQAWLALAVASLVGCAFEGKVDTANAPERLDCVDTRDGERFSFLPADVRNVSIGVLGGESCFEVTDTAGTSRKLCSSHEAFIKCEAYPPKRPKGKR